jgi:hypothetical protein
MTGTNIEAASREILFKLLKDDKPWLIKEDLNLMEVVKIDSSFVIVFHLYHGAGESIYRITYTASTNAMRIKMYGMVRRTEVYSPFVHPRFQEDKQ